MPVSFLSEAERRCFNSFPADLSTDDLIAFFTLSEQDLRQIPKTTTASNRFGFALRILLLRFLGFHIMDLTSVPAEVIDFIASQVGAKGAKIEQYAERGATRTVHQRAIEKYLGFRLPTERDLQIIGEWLLVRALEHDRPALLLQLLCERFLAEKLVRPGFSVVERMVATARNEAEEEIFRRVESIIDEVLIKHKRKSMETRQFPEHFDPAGHLERKINIRMENGKLIVTKLPGEELTSSSEALKELIAGHLPEIELTDLLIEVDGWTNFSRFFEHPSGNEPRTPDALRHCYACILAGACNFGFMQMQRMSGLTYRKMAWYSTWYLGMCKK